MNTKDLNIPKETYKSWQEITDILAELLRIPAALVMQYTDPEIQVFASSSSKGNPYTPGDKEVLLGSGLYCERVIKTQKVLKVPDALKDPEWDNNPDIKLNMVSYMGYPLTLPDGTPYGTICVLDDHHNAYTETEEKLLGKFRNLVESQLEMLYTNQLLGDKNRKLSDYIAEIQALRGMVPICSNCKSIRTEDNRWHDFEEFLIKNPVADFTHSLCPTCYSELYPDNE